MNAFENIPSYEGGKASPYIYNVGCGMENDLDAPTDRDCYAMLITETDANSYCKYVDKLRDNGYAVLFGNRIGDNIYTLLTGNGNTLYVYYTHVKGEVRIISDPVSTDPVSFGYSFDGNGSEIYQYALHYDPSNGHSPTTTNCGMLFMVRLADNSLYMYDAGDLLQCSDKALEGMMDFMHRITNTPWCEKIRICAWHISHAHNDHFCGCAKMLNRYHSQLSVERFMFNFPSSTVRRPDSQTGIFKEMINKYCPDALYIKLHTGQSVQLADVTLQVLYTHEDSVNLSTGKAVLEDVNDSSTVLRVSAGEMSMIVTGDMNMRAQEMIMNAFSEKTLSASILQVSHHGFNNVSSLYNAVKAPIAIIPQSEGYMSYNKPDASAAATNRAKREILTALRRYATIYYSGSFSNTVGFAVRNGKVTVIYGS